MSSLVPRLNIVGAGDVVAHRIVPALAALYGSEFVSERVSVHTVDASDSLSSTLIRLGVTPRVHDRGETREANEDALANELVAEGAPTIVATPSSAHLHYARVLTQSGVRCAVEKPLSTIPAEIALLARLPGPERERLFALSYYMLEKGLPFTYLLAPHAAFEPLLEIDAVPLAEQPGRCAELRQKLGALKYLQVSLIEGRERSPAPGRRAWTEVKAGLAFETLLHPLLLAKHAANDAKAEFARFMPHVTRGCSRSSVVPDATNFLRLDGRCGSLELSLIAAKYAGETSQKRGGVAVFEHGEARFDFDHLNVVVALRGANDVTIGLKSLYRGKYLAQCTLATAFFTGGWGSEARFDGYTDQVEVLEWLLAHDLEAVPAFEYDESTNLAVEVSGNGRV